MVREIFTERRIVTPGIDVFIGERTVGGGFKILRPGVVEELLIDDPQGEPSLHLKYAEAQRLMDELWNCGVRPSEGMGSAGSLAATERHLKDMQTIAFGLLKLHPYP